MNTSRRFEDLLQQFYDEDNGDDFANVDFHFQDTNLTQETDMTVKCKKGGHENKAAMETTADEQHLSQKLSQLSTTEKQDNIPPQQDMVTSKRRFSMEPPFNITKKMKIDNEKLENEMPEYLSASNREFDKFFNPLLLKTANAMSIEDIRQVALLCHKMAMLDLHKLLWGAYFCSGTGKITFENQQQPTASSTLSIWPEEVKSTMMIKGATNDTNETVIDNNDCLNFVHKTLRDFNDRFEQYQTQLHEKQDLLPHFTEEMQEAIAQFIEHEGLASHLIQIKIKVAAVEYTYKDRVIEAEFLQLNPNDHQVRYFQQINCCTEFFGFCFLLVTCI